MSKFRKVEERSAPAMNTASLPDIVFMLLFFFMVATTSKETDPTVKYTAPEGSRTEDLTPYKQRSEIDFLYLGAPRNPNRTSAFKFGYALSLDNVVQATPDGLYSTNAVSRWKKDKFITYFNNGIKFTIHSRYGTGEVTTKIYGEFAIINILYYLCRSQLLYYL